MSSQRAVLGAEHFGACQQRVWPYRVPDNVDGARGVNGPDIGKDRPARPREA